jgi:hypothetical protein
MDQSSSTRLRWLCAAASLCLSTHGMAQSVVAADTAVPLAPRVVQQAAATDSLLAPDYKEAVSGTPITFGEFRIFPQALARYLHATGLPLGQGTNVDTDIFTFTPGLTAELGEHWIANYSPSWVSYSASNLRDSVNQSFQVTGATTTVSEWNLKLSESYQSSNDVLAETAQQTKQNSWETTLAATRKLGQRSNYEGTAGMVDHTGDTFPDSRTWSTQQWLKMQVSPKVNAGLGLGLGYVEITRAADLNYEQYLAQVNWQTTEKIDLSLQGGLEDLHSQSAGVADSHTPTLQASLGYQPFENTKFSATGFRTVSNSYFTNTLAKNKGWSVGLNQRLLEKLHLELSYTAQTSDYSAFGGATSPVNAVVGRSDDLQAFNSTLSVLVLKHWTVAAIYQTSKNTSNQTGFRFSTTQYGLELRAKF